MGDFNSKKVKGILKSFLKKKHGSALPAPDDERRLTPILAHTSEEAVSLHPSNVVIAHSSLEGHPYNYLLTLVRRNKIFHAALMTYLISDEGEEIEFALDERAFYETEHDQVVDFISAPCRFFDLKNTHKRIIIFKEPIAITENQFKKVIKTWKESPPT